MKLRVAMLTIHMGNIRTFDLNLVRIFDALLRHGSVSAAAKALNQSQPTVSNALNRLRALTNDDLFVRTRRGMEPTNYALEIADALKDGLELIHNGLSHTRTFNAATTNRRFRVLMTDAGEMVFLPRLMLALREQAPGIDIEVRQLSVDRYVEALETGDADLAFGNVKAISDRLYFTKLFEEHYVLVCRTGHAWYKRRPSMDDYANADHVTVVPPNTVGSQIDAMHVKRKIKPRSVLKVPHFMVLETIVAATDLVSAVPSRVAKTIAEHGRIQIIDLPFKVPNITIGVCWHRRQQLDAGNRWMRNLLTSQKW